MEIDIYFTIHGEIDIYFYIIDGLVGDAFLRPFNHVSNGVKSVGPQPKANIRRK